MVSTSASAFASGVIEQKGLVLRKFKMQRLDIESSGLNLKSAESWSLFISFNQVITEGRVLSSANTDNCSQNPNGSYFSDQHIAELKPGILSVHEGSEVTKYFISSGVVFIHANSFADIVAVEAIPVDHIDPCLVQNGFAEFTQKLSSASADLE
ncbi:hypothetical protein AAC387_Pa04g2279 [Persea americana]